MRSVLPVATAPADGRRWSPAPCDSRHTGGGSPGTPYSAAIPCTHCTHPGSQPPGTGIDPFFRIQQQIQALIEGHGHKRLVFSKRRCTQECVHRSSYYTSGPRDFPVFLPKFWIFGILYKFTPQIQSPGKMPWKFPHRRNGTLGGDPVSPSFWDSPPWWKRFMPGRPLYWPSATFLPFRTALPHMVECISHR